MQCDQADEVAISPSTLLMDLVFRLEIKPPQFAFKKGGGEESCVISYQRVMCESNTAAFLLEAYVISTVKIRIHGRN